VTLNGVNVSIAQQTNYPSSGNVTITVDPAAATAFPLSLRIPKWCPQAAIRVNGQPVTGPIVSGEFYAIQRTWRAGDRVDLEMPMAWRFVKGRKLQAGRFAVLRGPTVFCFNPDRQTSGVDMSQATVDPATIQGPFVDNAIRPGGLSCTAQAKVGATYYDIFLSEFPDPGGQATYFWIENPADPALVDDELFVTGGGGGSPTLTASPSSVAPGGTITVAVSYPGNADRYAWIDNPWDWNDWRYLSGSQTPPSGPLTSATLTYTAPGAAGSYQFTLRDGLSPYSPRATSNTVTVP